MVANKRGKSVMGWDDLAQVLAGAVGCEVGPEEADECGVRVGRVGFAGAINHHSPKRCSTCANNEEVMPM